MKAKAVILGLAGVALAFAAGVNAYANHFRLRDPGETLRWFADDPVALALKADQREVLTPIGPAEAGPMADIARRALRSGPLTGPALRQLAVAEGLANRPAVSRRLLDLAHRVTRHDLGTSWLLVEQALDEGRIDNAMRNFDEALTTSLVARDIMYPALAAGLFDAGVRQSLQPYITAERPWITGFFQYSLRENDSVEHVVSLLLDGRSSGASEMRDALSPTILNALASRRNFPLARVYLARLPGVGVGVTEDIRFTVATTNDRLGPFRWVLVDQNDRSARRGASGGLQLWVGADVQGQLTSRTLLLAPGRYRLAQRQTASVGMTPVKLLWSLTCLGTGPGTLIWSADIASGSSGNAAWSFDIPATCSAQALSLTADNVGNEIEAGQMIDLTLRRTGDAVTPALPS